METLLIATGNPGKFKEMMRLLDQVDFALRSLKDLTGIEVNVDENGSTHDANALIKARHFWNQVGGWVLAEDSGIEVDAIQDELGIHTRRWGAGAEATDEAWLEYFMKRMSVIPESERGARFLCSAALISPDGVERLFQGHCEGVIRSTVEAPILSGLPLSSVFCPKGYQTVYAALSEDDKNRISHRGLAIGKVCEFLKSYS